MTWWADGEMVNGGESGDEHFIGDAATPDDAIEIVEAHNLAIRVLRTAAAETMLAAASFQGLAWIAPDGEHLQFSHVCNGQPKIDTLPNSIWPVPTDGNVKPSIHCADCGFHEFLSVSERPQLIDTIEEAALRWAVDQLHSALREPVLGDEPRSVPLSETLHAVITERLDQLAGSDGDMCAQDWTQEDSDYIAIKLATLDAERESAGAGLDEPGEPG